MCTYRKGGGGAYRGKRNRASQPRVPRRFSSVSVHRAPRNLPAERQADPRASGLVVKKGTNTLAVF